MKLEHNGTRFTDDTVRAMIAFAKPGGTNLDGWRVKLHQGRWSDFASGHCQFKRIYVRVGRFLAAPKRLHRPGKRGYLPSTAHTSFEDLLFVLAHELRHAWQFQHPRGRRVWGSRGRLPERDADAYAIRVVRAFRREGFPGVVAAKPGE